MKLRWRRFQFADFPGEFWQEWDELNSSYNASHPMMDSRFVARLVEYFPADIDILAGSRGTEIVALILVESKGQLIVPLYRPSQIQLGLAILPNQYTHCYQNLMSCMSWKVMRLDFYSLDPLYHSALISEMNHELENGAINMVIEIADSFDEYWCKRPKNLRKNISRYLNRISREFGDVRLNVVAEPDAMKAAVERYASIESRGWKGRAGTALHPGNVQGGFYRDVMQDYASVGEAYVFELYLVDQLVASRLCIANKEQLIILKTTYDEDYANYATGRVLLYETVKYVFDKKLSSRIDFYTNATQDQLQWATDSRVMYNLSMYRSSAKALTKVMGGLRKLVRF